MLERYPSIPHGIARVLLTEVVPLDHMLMKNWPSRKQDQAALKCIEPPQWAHEAVMLLIAIDANGRKPGLHLLLVQPHNVVEDAQRGFVVSRPLCRDPYQH